jgi:hypothetical protein
VEGIDYPSRCYFEEIGFLQVWWKWAEGKARWKEGEDGEVRDVRESDGTEGWKVKLEEGAEAGVDGKMERKRRRYKIIISL